METNLKPENWPAINNDSLKIPAYYQEIWGRDK